VYYHHTPARPEENHKASAIENQKHIKERATIRKCDGPAPDESGLISSARLMLTGI
jgi:hypothetical protein